MALSLFAAASLHAAPLVNFTLSLDTGVDPGSQYTNFFAGGSGSASRFAIGFQLTLHTVDGAPVNIGPIAAFCSEIAEPIGTQSYTFQAAHLAEIAAGQAGFSASASAGIPVGGIGALRAARVAYLFDKYYISDKLTAWNYSNTNPTTHAFQLALWELTHDTDMNLSNTSGFLYLGNQGGNALREAGVNIAQNMLNDVNGANLDESYASSKFKIWALVDTNGAGTTGWQDVVVAVPLGSVEEQRLSPLMPAPEPTTATLFFLSAGAFLLGHRVRRKP